ncbi:MAG: flagellin [Deltaproteobacteria bacterium]|nr:flagellin [Deltaproteobacteria bacterium]
MRVTDLTKQNAVLRNINNNSERLQTLQENMSSGKRINRLSDDPIGSAQVQDFRTRLSYLDMLKHNIQQNYIWLDRTESELAHIGEILSTAKTLALSQANDSADISSRRVTSEEMKSIEKALLMAGNAKIGKIYIFGGSKTLTQPLTENVEIVPATVNTEALPVDMKYLVDEEQFKADFKGFSKNNYLVRISQGGEMGRAQYQVSDDDGKTWSREKTLIPVVEMLNESGKSSDKVYLRFQGEFTDKLGEPLYYPPGLEYQYEPNPKVEYRGNDDKRMTPSGEGSLYPVNLTAKELFFQDPDIPRSVDIFNLIHSLTQALEDNDPMVLQDRLLDLDQAHDQVLNKRADVGAIRRELESQMLQLSDREFSNTKQMSDIEDLDFPSAVTEMNLADVRNKATLDTSTRLIQPSLLSFLR